MKKIFLFLFFMALLSMVYGNQIDIGIFETSSVPSQVEIRIRPDFDINSTQTITAILYTVRWDDPEIELSVQGVFPFFIDPQGPPVFYNGFYYQIFAAVPMTPIAMEANQEYLASAFTYTNGECAKFEIIEDGWTYANNGDVYFELLGQNVSGIIFQPDLVFQSVGGFIQGVDNIIIGNPTGPLTINDYNGYILYWERKIGEGAWNAIPGTEGLTVYDETPETIGNYYYRVMVQYELCIPAISQEHHVFVRGEVNLDLTVFLEGAYLGGQMTTILNQNSLLPLTQPYSGLPWNYNGTESVPFIPSGSIVDWILVELRDAENAASATAATRVAMQAAFLRDDGSVIGLYYPGGIYFDVTITKQLFVVIRHRNHIPVMSSVPLTESGGIYTYNFSLSAGQVNGGALAHKQLFDGYWGLTAADGNADSQVNNQDDIHIWEEQTGSSGYKSGDFNLDGQVNNVDKNNVWKPNTGRGGQVPQ